MKMIDKFTRCNNNDDEAQYSVCLIYDRLKKNKFMYIN